MERMRVYWKYTYPIASGRAAAGRMKGRESALRGLAVGNGSDVGLHIVLAALKNSSVAGRKS